METLACLLVNENCNTEIYSPNKHLVTYALIAPTFLMLFLRILEGFMTSLHFPLTSLDILQDFIITFDKIPWDEGCSRNCSKHQILGNICSECYGKSQFSCPSKIKNRIFKARCYFYISCEQIRENVRPFSIISLNPILFFFFFFYQMKNKFLVYGIILLFFPWLLFPSKQILQLDAY